MAERGEGSNPGGYSLVPLDDSDVPSDADPEIDPLSDVVITADVHSVPAEAVSRHPDYDVTPQAGPSGTSPRQLDTIEEISLTDMTQSDTEDNERGAHAHSDIPEDPGGYKKKGRSMFRGPAAFFLKRSKSLPSPRAVSPPFRAVKSSMKGHSGPADKPKGSVKVGEISFDRGGSKNVKWVLHCVQCILK